MMSCIHELLKTDLLALADYWRWSFRRAKAVI